MFGAPSPQPIVVPGAPTPPPAFGISPIGAKPRPGLQSPTFLGSSLAPTAGNSGSKTLLGQ